MGGPSGAGVRGRKDFYADVEVHSDRNQGRLDEQQQPLRDNASTVPRAGQQPQQTPKQASALMELQKRFVQQERQLQASMAAAAGSNASEGADVEPYFPKERVALEQDTLHKVEAQIEEVSASVEAATKGLPQLTQEQAAAQVQQLVRADQLMGRLSRVAAAISLRTNDPLTESGHDSVAGLRHYYGTVASTNVTLSWQEALARQSRPTSAQLGIAHVEPYSDAESDLESLDVRLEYALAELTAMADDAPCHIGMVTTWSGDLWGIRREMLPWITYHAQLGVSKLYVLYDGNDRNTHTALLDLHPYVRVILASAPLASVNETEEFEAWLRTVPDSHIKEWSSQPGNYQLMTKQGFAATKALELARQDNVSWLIHMDPDELLHPAAAPTAGDMGAAFSLLPELCGAPDSVPSIRFVNVEAVPETADINNRYEQVTLFRAHRHLVQPGAQPYRYIFKQGHADAWLHLYTNGKSAVRPDAPGVTQGGPHVFLGPADKRWVTPDNPHGLWHPTISNSTLVLHYAYTTPGDVAVKAGRSCPESVVEAVLAGDVAQASRCFVLDIDQRAFLAAIKDRKAAGLPVSPAALPAAPQQQQDASSGPVRELLIDSATMAGLRTSSGFSNASWPVGKEVLDFFWGELALSEGAPFECLTPDGQAKGWCAMSSVGHLKSLLISSGLMLRLHAPAQAMKGIEAAIEQLLMVTGRAAAKPVAPGQPQLHAVLCVGT
ncbi:hypothetical protein OEZ86_011012 [Tetradesmus obliquus]|nr:hypothetical protein OEZ86_011012 [Tetradesmus obliquus]